MTPEDKRLHDRAMMLLLLTEVIETDHYCADAKGKECLKMTAIFRKSKIAWN